MSGVYKYVTEKPEENVKKAKLVPVPCPSSEDKEKQIEEKESER